MISHCGATDSDEGDFLLGAIGQWLSLDEWLGAEQLTAVRKSVCLAQKRPSRWLWTFASSVGGFKGGHEVIDAAADLETYTDWCWRYRVMLVRDFRLEEAIAKMAIFCGASWSRRTGGGQAKSILGAIKTEAVNSGCPLFSRWGWRS